MAVAANLLRELVPLASLSPPDRVELAQRARLGNFQPRQVLFTRGDSASTVVYLIEGEVELFDGSTSRTVQAGTPAAREPLAQGKKRATTATCVKDAQVLYLDAEALDLALTWKQTGSVEVSELDSANPDGDWMTALLASSAFHRIPPANIGQIFAAMKPQRFKSGEILIRQGDPGDAYYVVTEGRCHVLWKDDAGRLHERGKLGPGQGFGEEALVSGNPRNASVRALSDGALMRLAGADFLRLLKAPLLREIAVDEIPEQALLVDVRLPEEFKRGRLPGAINLPLADLRTRVAGLDRNAIYVVYCDTARRSASATYLLSERGFDARLLAGGVPAEEMPVRG
jgi:CRP-like cAMP-binding protein